MDAVERKDHVLLPARLGAVLGVKADTFANRRLVRMQARPFHGGRVQVVPAHHDVRVSDRSPDCRPETVRVDLQEAEALAHRLLIVDTMPSEQDMTAEATEAVSSDLLPDWYEDWAMIEAEDWRQLRLHALEALAEKLITSDRFGDAIQAVRAAMKADSLRESPPRSPDPHPLH